MRYDELFEYMKSTIYDIEQEKKENPNKTYTPDEVIDIIEEYINMSYDCR